MKDKNLVSKLLTLKGNFVDILLVAIALSFSVGIFGAVSIEIFNLATPSILVLSLTLALILVMFLAHRILDGLERTIRFEGSLVFKETDQGIIPVKVPKYKISEKVSEYLLSAFSENPALKKIWDENPIECSLRRKSNNKFDSNSLILQTIEYVILDELSMHIQSYFSENEIDQSILKEHTREDLPEFLFKNKIFDLFTKPMNERPSFMNHGGGDDSLGKVVFAMGKEGEIFNHFQLTLPVGSSLSRSDNGAIKISTKVFELSINPRFEGFSNVWPTQFEVLYLGVERFDEVHSYQLNLDIDIKFNQLSLLMGNGWEYYAWIDSLISKLESYIDDEKFIEDIGWNIVYTSYIVSKNQPILPNKSSKSDAVNSACS